MHFPISSSWQPSESPAVAGSEAEGGFTSLSSSLLLLVLFFHFEISTTSLLINYLQIGFLNFFPVCWKGGSCPPLPPLNTPMLLSLHVFSSFSLESVAIQNRDGEQSHRPNHQYRGPGHLISRSFRPLDQPISSSLPEPELPTVSVNVSFS